VTGAVELEVVPLGRYPGWIRIVARWHWDEWGRNDPDGSLGGWTERIAGWAGLDGMPCTLVAVSNGVPVGSVSLLAEDRSYADQCAGLSPWLSSLLVVPSHRLLGVGTRLTRAAEAQAASFGVRRLYLHTSTAQRFYAGLGWENVAEVLDRTGRPVAIMDRDLATNYGRGS